MNAITALQPLARPFFQIISTAPGVLKIYEFVINNFYLLESVCVFGYGLKEVGIDTVWYKSADVKEAETKSWCGKAFAKILQAQNQPKEFYTLHGTLMLSSGAFGIGSALLGIGLFSALSDGLFVLASAIAVKYYIEKYKTACNDTEKASAIMGLLSSLGYVFCGALLVIGASASLALLIGCVAVATGCIKILYDNWQTIQNFF